MQAIKAYNILKKNYSETEAQTLIDYFESTPKDLATKSDISELKTELKSDINGLKTDMANLETRLLKWVLGTGVGTVITMAGLLKVMIK